ncbi:MAG TPA: DUF2723 domain-containing protein [Gemmatimonadaceae bacterium]|nr:DUF2723 domain-containing protein [Gemmatimonadaceae bacterium]
MSAASPRRAFVLVGTTLGVIYLASLAPGVTFWDAGEFASAVESFGIPHPPGTPLFILVARVWRLLFGFLPTAIATNLLAAACTAVAGGVAAIVVTRWTRDVTVAFAAGVGFGSAATVWLNATETEVYSASLLLSVIMLYVGVRAHVDRRTARAEAGWPTPRPALGRYDLLLAYLFAITPPLHLSAMVAAPAAIALATIDRDLRIDGLRAGILVAAAVLATGVGTGSLPIAAAGLVMLAMWALATWHRPDGHRDATAILALIAVGASSFLYLLVRARYDPAINQGDPANLAGVIEVIARRQYDVAGLWPRRAPLWLQIGNFIQYADWQYALGLDQWVGASPVRTPLTAAFVALGIVGSQWHRRRDRRTWAALVVLVASATLGVVLYLNLKAGPSFGYGVLPANADREARERDYFFALGFAGFGLWIGMGAVALARRIARRTALPRLAIVGPLVAALPFLLNWRAVDRRREPAATLPDAFARATLESAPPRAVLFVAGDNDTYPLWYVQVAEHVRRDVTVVTVPLIPAEWYRAELARRQGLYELADTARWKGTPRELTSIADRVRRAGRPVAAAVSLEPDLRAALGAGWTFRGLIYVSHQFPDSGAVTEVDQPAVDSTAAMVARLFGGPVDANRVDDPAARYIADLLLCPTIARRAVHGGSTDSGELLASRCNFR